MVKLSKSGLDIKQIMKYIKKLSAENLIILESMLGKQLSAANFHPKSYVSMGYKGNHYIDDSFEAGIVLGIYLGGRWKYFNFYSNAEYTEFHLLLPSINFKEISLDTPFTHIGFHSFHIQSVEVWGIDMEEVIDLREAEFDKEKLKGLVNPVTNFIFSTDLAIIFIGSPTEYTPSTSIGFFANESCNGGVYFFLDEKGVRTYLNDYELQFFDPSFKNKELKLRHKFELDSLETERTIISI